MQKTDRFRPLLEGLRTQRSATHHLREIGGTPKPGALRTHPCGRDSNRGFGLSDVFSRFLHCIQA